MANWAPPCRVLVDCVSEWCAREGVKMRSFPGVGLGHRALKRARYCAIVFGAACSATTMSFSFFAGVRLYVYVRFLCPSLGGRKRARERERFTAAKKVTKAFTKHRKVAHWHVSVTPALSLLCFFVLAQLIMWQISRPGPLVSQVLIWVHCLPLLGGILVPVEGSIGTAF